jgi:hypothetical protein
MMSPPQRLRSILAPASLALPAPDNLRRPRESAPVWLTAGKATAKNAQSAIHAALGPPRDRTNPANTPFRIGMPFALFAVVIIGEQ